MKIQMLVAGAFALIQSVVSGHEVPSFRGQVAKLQAESHVEVLADEDEEEDRRRSSSRSRRSWRRNRGSRRNRWGRNRRGRRRGGFRRRRGRSFSRCMSRCTRSRSSCRRRCDFSEQDILDLFYFTGGFSEMPEDEDFEAYDYGAASIQDAMEMVIDPESIFASLMDDDDKCEDETEAIYEDAGFLASLGAMAEMCPVTEEETETTATQTWDFSGDCGLGDVEAACVAAGGAHLTYSFTVVCKGVANPEYVGTLNIVSGPLCAGTSCTAQEATAEEEEEIEEEIEDFVEDELEKAGIEDADVKCEITFA